MNSLPFHRFLAGGLSLVFLATNSLLAYSPETSLWAERRKTARRQQPPLLASLPLGRQSGPSLTPPPPTAQNPAPALFQNVARSVPKGFVKEHAELLSALSPAHGTIRKVSLSPQHASLHPIIVHIQDVHMNAEAQWNIREAVSSLMRSGRVNLVALEGAAVDIPLQPFVDFPNRRAVELTADYLLKENKISGPIHAALTAQGKLPRILGIEDPLHYQANIQAYRDSALKLEQTRQWVQERKSAIAAKKKQVFSAALHAFDEKVESYREGKTPLGDYVLLFSSPSGQTTRPRISLFQKALALERTLDFGRVEAERTRLIEALTAKLGKQEIDTLLAQSLAYRSGQVRYADFYTGLKTLCRKKDIDLTAYPAMNEYVQYVLLADGIDVETLMADLAEAEKAAYANLAKSGSERDLIAKSRRAWLTGKLVDFALTPVEWREYISAKSDAVASAEPSPALASFESFYHEADARDAAMAKSVIAAVSQAAGSPSPATVLVTGGYHAEGIAKALTAGGFTVISYVPKIEKVATDRGSAYLSVFTQEKTPLDRLFQGQQLYLANAPIKPADVQLALPGLIAVADNAETFGSVRKSFLSLVPPALTARFKKIVEKSSEQVTRLRVLFKDGWVYTVEDTPGTSSEDHRFTMEIKKKSLNPFRRFGERLFDLPATPAAALRENRDVLKKLVFSGRATSRWMTKVFEFVGGRRGGVEGARQAGAHYKAHAPAYEWSLGFAMAVANIGAVLFLAGTAWALVPLLLTALFLPSHVLPARWLKTEVKVGWAKAGLMGLFYFALVAVAPLLALDFGWTQGFLQAAGWGLTLALHRRFDPGVDQTHRRDFFGRPIKSDRDIVGLPFSDQPTIVLGKGGIHPEFGSTRPTPETGPTRTARGPPAPEVAAETSPLVSKDYVPGIYRENDLVEKFPDAILQIQRWGREAVIDRQLRLLVLNGELDKSREEELRKKARDLLSEAEGAEGFNPTTMERNVLVCEIVRKVVPGKTSANPFSVRNLKTNNIAAALQENGLPLRRRLLRLLHSFEALKYMADEELYNQEEETISKNLLERVRSFDDRVLAIDAFDSYMQRVVRSRKPITVPVFFDDNGEAVFALRFILDQMLLNPHLRFVLVARNGQFREDASVNDLHRILKLPVFRKDVQSVGSRLRVMAGCAGDGIDARKFSPELVQTLLSADVVLSIGQMNFENLNTFKKDVYFLFVTHALANAVVSGVPVGKGIFAFLPAGTRAFSGYTDSSFRRFQYGDGVTIPVAGKTLIEAAAGFPENRINENFVIVDNSEKGKNQGGPPSSNSGRATSRWMTRFFERLGFYWGGETSAERWGAHYKAHAPAYEWSLGFAMAAANIGAVLFLAGTAWALVPLLLTALFLPSHVLPARWLKTEVKVGWVKAGLMGLFYFALVAVAPLLVTDFSWTQAFLQAAGWGLTLTLHHRFDPKVDKSPPSREAPAITKNNAEALLLKQTLTTEQRRFAAQVTAIVGAKPTRLGLEDYMHRAAQAAVQAAVSGRTEGTPVPSVEDIQGTPVLFVDARSVATKQQRTALAAFLKGKPDAVIFTNADDLMIAGVDVRVRREAFSALDTLEGDHPSGVVEVALAPLGPELRDLAGGRGLQLFQTAALKLNSLGADETVVEAAKEAWLLSELFTLLAPVLAPERWDDILKVLTAIAQSA